MKIASATILSLLVGVCVEAGAGYFGTAYMGQFLKGNLLTLLVALLAINLTTMGVVLMKLKEIEQAHQRKGLFVKSKSEMLSSVKQQIALISISAITLMTQAVPALSGASQAQFAANAILVAVFVYALIVLYDTAKSVFSLLDA